MPNVRVANFFGGFPIKQQIEQLKTNPPHAVVGTPGRIKQVRLCLFSVLFFLQRSAAVTCHGARHQDLICLLVQLAAGEKWQPEPEDHPPLHRR